MGLFLHPDQRAVRPSRLRLLLVIMLVFGCVKLFGGIRHRAPIARPPPIIAAPGVSAPDIEQYHFTGRRVRGNGTNLDLGDRRTHLPGSFLSRFFPNKMVLSSCLTEPVPPPSPATKLLPVRDDWPGFYGAPWIARINGNLIVLLDVFAPRDVGGSVPPPDFQIYPAYEAAKAPSFSAISPARFYRGSKAVLYRVFLTGPVRCLDLVVQNGENSGTGHLYYQKFNHYYEADAKFDIQH